MQGSGFRVLGSELPKREGSAEAEGRFCWEFMVCHTGPGSIILHCHDGSSCGVVDEYRLYRLLLHIMLYCGILLYISLGCWC